MTNLGAMMTGGSRGRQANDFYPTPPDVTKALLGVWSPPKYETIWEPACGHGAIANILAENDYSVYETDIRQNPPVDFLLCGRMPGVNSIITNPPFALAEKFIRHAHHLGINQMALLLKATYWHAAGRSALWADHRPSMILPLTWRPDFLNLGGPTMDVCWNVWDDRLTGETIYHPLARPIR